MKKKLFAIGLMVLFAAVFCRESFSQIRETGVIHGYVRDDQGEPLPGATVSISGPKLIGGRKTYISDKYGYYRFPTLPPGPYTLSAELQGFGKYVREVAELHANMTFTVDFKMKQTSVDEEIIVTANTPTIDVKSSQGGTATFSTELIQTLPGKPTLRELFSMAPGTNNYTSYGSGYSTPNTFQLDGVSVTDPNSGINNFKIDTNVIEEATFQGLGMPAEFGEASGAVLTAVTKSGSNKLSGSADFRYNGEGWNSQNLGSFAKSEFVNPATKDKKVEVGNLRDISGQVGGKIIQDKLWFFLSGGYNDHTEHRLGTTAVTKNFTPKVFTKLTYQLNKSNKFNVSFKYTNDGWDNLYAGANIPPGIDMNASGPGYFTAASWTSILSPTTYLDIKAGLNIMKNDMVPTGGMETPGHIDLFYGTRSVNMDSYSKMTGRTFHLSAHLSHYIPYFITGSHDITIGAEIQRDYCMIASGMPGGESYYDYKGQPFQKNTMSESRLDHYFGPIVGFFQDTWSLTKRLTLNVGFRYDNLYYKIPSPLAGMVYKNDALAPRLGLTYDLLGDRKNIFKLYYGHLVQKVRRDQFVFMETKSAGWGQYLWIDNAWKKIIEVLPGAAATIYTVDPKVKHPYIKELSAAYERELFKDASLTVNAYYKTLGAAMGPVNMTTQWATFTIINPGPDGIVGTSDDLGPFDAYQRTTPYEDDRYLITNPVAGMSPTCLETPWKKMRGIEFIFSKRYSNGWQLLASYHYTNCTGNTESVDDIYIYDRNQYVNNRGQLVSSYGQPHQFKLQGSVLLPLDIMLGVTAQYISGADVQSYFFALVNGGLTYFQGMPWGQKKCGPLKDVSMKFEKRFPIKGMELTAYVDFYNAFNFHSTPYASSRMSEFGPNFGKILSVQTPRSFLVGARFIF